MRIGGRSSAVQYADCRWRVEVLYQRLVSSFMLVTTSKSFVPRAIKHSTNYGLDTGVKENPRVRSTPFARGRIASRKSTIEPVDPRFLAALRARADAQGFCEATGSLWTTNKMSVWGQEYERWTPVDERLIHRLECSCNATWN
ncbi:unnamed protein product [Xylocopa violacea]|uniref:Uncharacterized protein n=1 Tax=Xylocopa violacea TaxID=135666 RepID=A0ABP1NJK5_XYLVO